MSLDGRGETLQRVRCQTCGRVVTINARGYFLPHTAVVVAAGQSITDADRCHMQNGSRPDGS